MREFGNLIVRTRQARGMRGSDLGDAIGRSVNYISRLERGTMSNPPEPQDFIKLSNVLGLSRLRMLRTLGYLDDIDLDENEGPAYQIGPDDVRAKLLDVVAGLPDEDVEAAVRVLEVVTSAYSRKPVTNRHSGNRDEASTEQLG